MTDCWNSRVTSPPPGWKLPPPAAMGGSGVGAPTVPYREAPFSRCFAYVESAYAWKEHLKHKICRNESLDSSFIGIFQMNPCGRKQSA